MPASDVSAEAQKHKSLLSPNDMAAKIAELGKEPKACLLCGADSPKRLFERSGKAFWGCPSCELVFVHDIYPEFADDVEHLEGTYTYYDLWTPTKRQLRDYDRRLELFDPYRPADSQGDLLEVGCGQGMFLQHVHDSGRWKATGVDILPEVAELARTRRGLNVHVGQLHEIGFEADRFDVVYLAEVIEHIVEPVPLLEEIRRVLRPGGVCVLDTGNARSWSARLRGSNWSYFMFGGHLHIRYYGPRSAAALQRAAGFKKCKVRTRSFAFAEAEELRGRWYKPLAKFAQGFISPLARSAGAGHRLRMIFEK